MNIDTRAVLVVGRLAEEFDNDELEELLDNNEVDIQQFAPHFDANRLDCTIGISVASDEEIDFVVLSDTIKKARAAFTEATSLLPRLYIMNDIS